MRGITTVFVNEEASRLLDYFISYKEMISKVENKAQDDVELLALHKP
jgi:hypothetical protein